MKILGFKIANFDKKDFLKNILLSLIITVSFLFIGLLISFILSELLPGDPVLAYLPSGRPDPEAYAYWEHELWLDRPFILQYFKYIFDLFTENWGLSMSINKGQDVWSLLFSRTPRTIDLFLFPTILGLILGIILGKVSLKFRKTWGDKLIQVFIILGISIPVFTFGIFLQNSLGYNLGLYPITGFKSSEYGDPALVTGFRTIDALISGEWYYITDYLYHLILPIFCLLIFTISLITHQTRCYTKQKARKRSIFSNTMMTIWIFGFIFIFSILIENIFELNGLFVILIDAIRESDYYVLRSSIFIILIIFIIITLISNITFSLLKSLTFERKKSIENNNSRENDDIINKSDINLETNPKRNLKKYLTYFTQSPFTLIGLIVITGIIILGSFPALISGYSIEEATTPIPFSMAEPPSDTHLLGTEEFGRDIFAMILWGIQNALINSFEAIIIGIVGGIIFGSISSINKYANKSIEALMLIVYVIPPILLIIFIVSISGTYNFYLISTTGILLIPFFTRIITHIPLNHTNILISLKKLIIYVPLAFSFVILFYESLAFLGFIWNYLYIPLGSQIAQGSAYVQSALWATFWPSLFLFFITLGFIMLHYGLKDTFIDGLESSRVDEIEREIKIH